MFRKKGSKYGTQSKYKYIPIDRHTNVEMNAIQTIYTIKYKYLFICYFIARHLTSTQYGKTKKKYFIRFVCYICCLQRLINAIYYYQKKKKKYIPILI